MATKSISDREAIRRLAEALMNEDTDRGRRFSASLCELIKDLREPPAEPPAEPQPPLPGWYRASNGDIIHIIRAKKHSSAFIGERVKDGRRVYCTLETPLTRLTYPTLGSLWRHKATGIVLAIGAGKGSNDNPEKVFIGTKWQVFSHVYGDHIPITDLYRDWEPVEAEHA